MEHEIPELVDNTTQKDDSYDPMLHSNALPKMKDWIFETQEKLRYLSTGFDTLENELSQIIKIVEEELS